MKYDELSGKRFSLLTAKRYNGSDKNGHATWECRCDCGNTAVVLAVNLKHGRTKSCGCLYKRPKTHGGTGTRLYKTWCSMKERCYRENDKSFPRYGGRGIKVCDEWRDDFVTFRKWAEISGYDDTLSIDRIDPNGSYGPQNCRWVSMNEQAVNKRNNHFIEYGGKRLTLSQWERETGILASTIKARIVDLGWDVGRALSHSGGVVNG